MNRKYIIIIIILIALGLSIYLNFNYIKGLFLKDINLDDKITFSKVDYPDFSINNIDKFISDYINNKYKDKVMNYSYYDLDGLYTSILIHNDTDSIYESLLIDNRSGNNIYIDQLTNDINTFNTYIDKKLREKYPSFIVEEVVKIDKSNISYLIDKEFLNIYYGRVNTKPIYDKEITLKISLFALKDIMLFNINDSVGTNIDINRLDKIVALTFDDGPSSITDSILDVLSDNNAKATFFMQGYKISSKKEVVEKLVKNGNEAGNHTYSHKYLTKLNKKEMDFQLDRTNEIYYEITNKNMLYIRPPYGSLNKKVKNSVTLPIVMWSLDTLDWKNKDIKKIISSVLDNVQDGDIILMHDTFSTTYEALKIILPELYVRGYKVTTVSELASIKNVSLKIGEVYNKIN